MTGELIELWPFNRAEAAELIGLEEGHLANWLNRYGLFPQKRRGTGYTLYFTIRELMTLYAVKYLVQAGFKPAKAIDALSPYQGPYGDMLHTPARRGRPPGTMYLSYHDGRLVGVDGADTVIGLEIHAWRLFDDLFPKIKNAIECRPGRHSPDEVKKAIAEFEAQIAEIRRMRWQDYDEAATRSGES